MFPGPLGQSLAGRGLTENLWQLATIDIRDFATDKHRSVDDTPAGGGPGMVLKADVVAGTIDCARREAPDLPLIYLSPRGHPLTQRRVRQLVAGPGVTLLAGRFEGIDQRVLEARSVEEVSLGDFVLSGGEIAAMALIDACVRLLPGIVGDAESLNQESFEQGLLEYPHYTRPREWRGARSLTCCYPATMEKSPTGGRVRQSGSPGSGAPIFGQDTASRDLSAPLRTCIAVVR